MKSLRLTAALAATLASGFAAETRIWSQGDHSDFDKGKRKGVALSSDGRVTLAPAFQEIFDSASVYLWSLAEDSKGNVYAGGGGPGGPGARVYEIARGGKGKMLAQLDDLEVHAVAVNAKDEVFAATAPDGKVYRIRAGKPEVFYDPKAKYIWDMAFDRRGDLYIATGDRGEVHRVTPNGNGSVFYKSTETHVRSLAFEMDGNLIAGTEPSGLILRVNPKGEAFVLYQAAKREITAVAVSNNGTIYAAAVGNKLPGATALPVAPPPPAPVAAPVNPAAPAPAGHVVVAPVPNAPMPVTPPSIPGGSEVYRIERDGFPHRIWTHPSDIAYAIGFDQDNRPLIGAGNTGTIYRIDSELVYTELLNAPPTQVTALFSGSDGRLYAATGNVGKVYQIGPGLEKEGTLESDVFDAGLYAHWGRLIYRGADHGGQIAFATRSGNLDRPQSGWSDWSAEMTGPEGGRIASPPARFLQWRATLTASASGQSPALDAVDVAYLPRNVAPEVRKIEITPPNFRFPPPPALPPTPAQTLNLPPLGNAAPRRPPAVGQSGGTSMQYAKGYLGARWSAGDDNGDSLSYTVEIRGANETEWKPLKGKVAEPYIAWDSTAFPDGDYRIRVIASDAPDNPADQALTGELVSDPFQIDNTPPEISGLSATAHGDKLTVKWHAADALNVIDRAEYSINGGEWTFVEPVGQLSDSKQEDYSVSLDRSGVGEQTIAVRVSDEYENRAVAKVISK